MGKERYYSPKEENKQHNEVNIKVRFTYKQGEFDLFLNVFKVGVGCRDPPYQFVLKIQIDRRKERWQNAQKEERVRIILIY